MFAADTDSIKYVLKQSQVSCQNAARKADNTGEICAISACLMSCYTPPRLDIPAHRQDTIPGNSLAHRELTQVNCC